MKTVEPGDSVMNFWLAGATRIGFGQFKGFTIEEIYNEEKGPRYLDWLCEQEWVRDDLVDAIECFLGAVT